MHRKIRPVVAAVFVVGALVVPSIASGAATKECTEEGSPHKNFTTSFTQTPAWNSNSEVNKSSETVTNKGGNQPGGQQPRRAGYGERADAHGVSALAGLPLLGLRPPHDPRSEPPSVRVVRDARDPGTPGDPRG